MRVTREAYTSPFGTITEGVNKAYVHKAFLGWFYAVDYTKPQYYSLSWTWHGWRPTKRWAAKKAARLHLRWKANAEGVSGKISAFDVLAEQTSQKDVRKARRDLQRTITELKHDV